MFLCVIPYLNIPGLPANSQDAFDRMPLHCRWSTFFVNFTGVLYEFTLSIAIWNFKDIGKFIDRRQSLEEAKG